MSFKVFFAIVTVLLILYFASTPIGLFANSLGDMFNAIGSAFINLGNATGH